MSRCAQITAAPYGRPPLLYCKNTVSHTRAVHKQTELFFFNLLFYFQLNLTCHPQSTPLHSRYPAPNVFSISGTRQDAFQKWKKRVLRDGEKVPYRIFFYLLYRLKSPTSLWGFPLREQEKVRRGQIWRVGGLGDNSRLMVRKKFMDKEWRGTNFAATRRVFRFPVKIRWHELLQIRTSSATSRTVRRRSWRITASNFSTWSSSID